MKTLLVKPSWIDRALRGASLAVGLTLALFTEPLSASAQLPAKVSRIGFLSWLGCSDDPFLRGAFRDGLRDLGYVEGKNIVIECRSATGNPDRYPHLVAELVRLNVAVLKVRLEDIVDDHLVRKLDEAGEIDRLYAAYGAK